MRTRVHSVFLSYVISTSLLLAQTPSPNKVYVEPLQRIEAFKAPITFGASSASSGLVAVVSDKVLKMYDTRLGGLSELWTATVPQAPISALDFSPDGNLVVAGTAGGQAHIWNSKQGTLVLSLSPHTIGITSLGVAKNRFIVTAAFDRTVKVSDVTSGKVLTSVSLGQEEATHLAVNPYGDVVALGTSSGKRRLYSIPQLTPLGNLLDLQAKITSMRFSPDGRLFILGSSSGTIETWNTQSWKMKDQIQVQKSSVAGIAIDPKSRWLVSVALDSSFMIHSLTTSSPLKTLPKAEGLLSFIAFASEELLCAASTKGQLTTWRVLDTPLDSIPPTISFEQPLPNTDQTALKVFASEYEIKGIVQDEGEIMELAINGAPLSFTPLSEQGQEGVKQAVKTKKFSSVVKLENVGINAFEIKASDAAGNTASSTARIQRLSADQAVEVLNPGDNTEADKVSVKLQFKAWFDVASYSISVNLLEVVENQIPRSIKMGEPLVEEVPMATGYNQIQLTVLSKSGGKFSKTIGVNRKALGQSSLASSIKPLSRERGPEPQAWAIVVGISDYANPGIKSLDYAARDAEAFAEFLRKPQGGSYDDNHLKVLLNKEATLANLRDALIIFLSQAIDKDLVIIFFAGHGAPEPARPANTYLLMHDTDPAFLGTTAFPMWQIQDYLARYITAKRIVVFADACHSGALSVGYATRGASITESNLVNQYLSDLSKTKEGTVVFTASAAGEVSQEFPDLSHGAFTYYLLKGMEGEADFNNDYTVTINELMQYVEDQVKRKTRGAQNPTRSQTAYDKEMTISVIAH